MAPSQPAPPIFPPPQVSTPQLIDWAVAWIAADLPLLDKPTKFEVRDGRF